MQRGCAPCTPFPGCQIGNPTAANQDERFRRGTACCALSSEKRRPSARLLRASGLSTLDDRLYFLGSDAFPRNALNRSMGIGNTTMLVRSVAISFRVPR